MLRRAIVCIAAFAALPALLACDDGLTAPPRGLAVTLTRVNIPAPPTQFSVDADSVMIVLSSSLLTNDPCASRQLDAGVSGGALAITITSQVTMNPCSALAVMFVPTTRIVVHHVPSGTYAVVLAERVTPWRGRETETAVAEGQVTVR